MNTFTLPPQLPQCEELKPGILLVSRKRSQDVLLDRSVILLLEHDETGSTGIILNKPAVSAEATNDREPLRYGGTYDTHRIGVLLDTDQCTSRAVKIREGLFYCEHCSLLSSKNLSEELNRNGMKAFIGFTVWQSGALEKEHNQNNWLTCDFEFGELNSKNGYDWLRTSIRLSKEYAPLMYLN